MLVWEGERFGVALSKRDDIRKMLLHGERPGLAEKIFVDVGADDRIYLRRVSGEPTIQHARATANLENELSSPRLHHIDHAPYYA
jgi:hypothetical protein